MRIPAGPAPPQGWETAAAAAKPRRVDITPAQGLLDLGSAELWRYRGLLWVLVQRELRVRYKQSAIGAAWAVLQPILTVAIFSLVFGRFAKLPSGGAPYSVFVFAAVLPWTYFAEAVRRSSTCLVSDADLVRKIYFPRLLSPLAMAIAPLVDFAAGFLVLAALLAWTHTTPTPGLLLLPAFLAVAVALALAIGLWLGPLSVRYRDVIHALPFLIQIWLYASPVAYSMSIVPERWRLLYSLNPMVGVVEGFRWALLGTPQPDVRAIAISCGVILAALLGGLVFFRKMERSFADLI